MAGYEDHETKLVHRMRMQEAVHGAQIVGIQVAAFYLTLIGSDIDRESARLFTHTFLSELMGGCSCQYDEGEAD